MHAAGHNDIPDDHDARGGRGKKLIEVWTWTVEQAEGCKYCRDLQEQTGKAEDCSSCKYRQPELEPGNVDAWELWTAANTQWRIAGHMGGICFIGLDYNALYQVADTLCIEITPAMLAKIRLLESRERERQNSQEPAGAEDGEFDDGE